jgi:hypothetical protein
MSMCLSSSRSLVAPSRGLGGVALAAPWWRSLVGSALSSGAYRWRLQASARAFSGAALVAGFGCPAAAARFAAAWASWCDCSLAVRRFAGRAGPVWGVSVPVCVPPGARSLAAPPSSGRAGLGGARDARAALRRERDQVAHARHHRITRVMPRARPRPWRPAHALRVWAGSACPSPASACARGRPPACRWQPGGRAAALRCRSWPGSRGALEKAGHGRRFAAAGAVGACPGVEAVMTPYLGPPGSG